MSCIMELNCGRGKVVAHFSSMYSMRVSTPTHVNKYFIIQKRLEKLQKVWDKTVLNNV